MAQGLLVTRPEPEDWAATWTRSTEPGATQRLTREERRDGECWVSYEIRHPAWGERTGLGFAAWDYFLATHDRA